MKELLLILSREVDHIIIECSSNLDLYTTIALEVSNKVIRVTEPNTRSLFYFESTDTGITTFMSWLLSTVPDNKRIITVEEEVRKFNLIKRNEDCEIVNNVIHLSTKRGEDKRRDIDQLKLLETALTMNPDYMSEMKA